VPESLPMECEASLCRILRPGILWIPGSPVRQPSVGCTPGTPTVIVISIVVLCELIRVAEKPNRTEFLSPLTYSIDTTGQGGGFYFRTSMPLNRIVINRATWVAHFTADGRAPGQAATILLQDGKVHAVRVRNTRKGL
jgi:hypothetical protein